MIAHHVQRLCEVAEFGNALLHLLPAVALLLKCNSSAAFLQTLY
jgi:hypothetical protein